MVCGIVIFDSMRLGFNWREGEGPAPGYFPFYVAVILGISSLINLASARSRARRRRDLRLGTALRPRPGGADPEPHLRGADRRHLSRADQRAGLGIYVASAIFIIAFMMVDRAREPAEGRGRGDRWCPLALFLMFERWFLVPLPKGPLEAWLGY